jgi:hypothetical protein
MGKTKFTTGTWSVIKNQFSDDLIIKVQNGKFYKFVANISATECDDEEELNANARLMASAPELLEALNDLLQWANIKDGSPSQALRDQAIKAIENATLK